MYANPTALWLPVENSRQKSFWSRDFRKVAVIRSRILLEFITYNRLINKLPEGRRWGCDECPLGGAELQDHVIVSPSPSRSPLLQVSGWLGLSGEEGLAVQQHAFLHTDAQQAVHLWLK